MQGRDSGRSSATGEIPQEHGFRDEETHRAPLRKRPPGMETKCYKQILYFNLCVYLLIITVFERYIKYKLMKDKKADIYMQMTAH